ncbi:enoyl-CoA hydratase/isomerase family protein [Bacillus infantis]|uniref:2-(1,2-epoxy-1,2-dihydrophenyl)acetyl-CoA isomerase n=1 Tax=Bacillus infantis TaxID=324767 RepID=A0A5D4QUA4_9BACI|nr:enoyl-CoA hydratase-related protein [Bacillus infantis]TYS41930.1 2-(1,2-epoxy-1,2-dihydrophenyl)acetyl-CoA isomerase [Bacillus infantis]
MYQTIIYEAEGKIAWIRLNRPEKLNAFTADLNSEIGQALREAGSDPRIRAVVITGEGRAFCSGEDLGSVSENTDHGEILRKRYNPMVMELYQCEKPVIAAVNGVAAGAGMSLALACDFRLVSDKASFIQSFIHVGLIPDAGNMFFLPRLIGQAKALELALLGEKVSAEEALRLGLATRIIPHESWEEGVRLFADRAAALPTAAAGLIKKQLKDCWELNLNDYLEEDAKGQRMAGLTRDHQEGVQAFLEKRKAAFIGM